MYNSELIKLFDQLKKARNETSERLAQELQQYYLKNSSQYDEIFQYLQKIINSSDLQEKYNGLLGLDQISYVIQENQYMNFVNKFHTNVFQQFQENADQRYLKKTAEVYGRLLKLGGTRIQNILHTYITNAIDWLFNKNFKENRKYAGLLALKELLEQAPFVTFKSIIQTEKYRENIWNLIKNKSIQLREAALMFFEVYIKLISLKESDFQIKEYTTFYNDIQQSVKQKDDDVIIGNISVLKIILSYSNPDVFQTQQFYDMCEYVTSKRSSSSEQIQKAVIEALPILSKYKKQYFIENFFQKTIEFLILKIAQNRTSRNYNLDITISYYDTLNKICQCLDGGVYTKLDEAQQNIVFKNIELVTRTIRQDLIDRKPYIPSRILCLQNILKVFNAQYQQLIIDEDSLINNILFNGLYPQSIDFLKQIQKTYFFQKDQQQNSKELTKKKIDLTQSIQYKLLLCIITVLSKQKNTIPQSLLSRKQERKEEHQNFLKALNQINEQNKQNDEKSIANAIQTLSTFNFSKYENELANFVKDNVLDYLDDKNNKIIRKAAAKAGCLLYVKKKREQQISKNIMYEILEKFMSVAISDPEDEIRQTMLSSLNENFDQYLNEPNYLKKLFLCVNDSNINVQQLALTILCRLSKHNPSDIVPFLKKTLFEFLSQLAFDEMQNEKQMINLLSSLTCLIKNGPDIVKSHSESIAHILLNFLNDPNMTNNMIPELLKAFSQLGNLGEQNMLLYIDEVVPIILQAMQDKSSTSKREAAVKSFVDIIKCTGFVVLPYYKYPNFLEIILGLMKNEVNLEMRQQCMRLIGCLGAIDNFYYKKVVDKLKNKFKLINNQDNNEIVNSIVSKQLKKKFKFFEKFKNAKQLQGSYNLTKQLHQYYENIILLENFKQKKLFLKLANIQAESNQNQTNNKNSVNGTIFAKKDSKLRDQIQIDKINNRQENDEEIKVLLQAPTVISLNDEDYYSRVTIKALLKILCDNSLSQHHDLTVNTLTCIIGVLKNRTKNFLDIIIPVFTKIISQENLRQSLLDLIQKIIQHCGVHYDQAYIDPILNIFLEYGKEVKHQKICFQILENLIDQQKINLRHKMEPIIRLINNVINKPQLDNQAEIVDFSKKMIKIYMKLAELLDSNLHLIIPFLCQFINKNHSNAHSEVKVEIVKLFKTLALYCPSTIQFLSLIVDSILNYLNDGKNDQVTNNQILDTIVVFIYKYRNQFLVYLPKVNIIIKNCNIHHNQYSRCIEIFLNNGNLDDVSSQLENEYPNIVEQIQRQPPYTTESNNGIYRKMVNEKFIKVFDTSSLTSKEDWNQWIRKTSVELLKESPNLILSPCHQLAEVYEELQTELYNISFACVWSFLRDKDKEFIINQLTKAINPQHQDADNIPINILQTILNLAEFMQHDKDGLQIDNSTLGDLAERCMAYAKALYYREHEFETANEETIEILISLYTNLGQREAANGLLNIVKNQLGMNQNMSWYERLHQWENALDDYRVRQLNQVGQNFFVPKMRCLNALSDWEKLIKSTEDEKNMENRKQVMHLAANAAMHLGKKKLVFFFFFFYFIGKWDQLELYTEQVNDDYPDKNFWNAALCIQKAQFEDARQYISESILKLDSQVSGLLLESYNRAYDSILRLQQLFEMQEIIEIKEFEDKVKQAQKENREGLTKIYLQQDLEQKKKQLQDVWIDRLNGNPKDIDTWQNILSVRQLLLSKVDNMDTQEIYLQIQNQYFFKNRWLKFCRLALKGNQMKICQKSLDELMKEQNPDPGAIEFFDYPPKVVLANLECSYQMCTAKEQQTFERMDEFLQKNQNQIDKKLTAKMFLKMGNWLRDKAEDLSQPEIIEKIERFYQSSKNFKADYYKTWHHYALLNFDAINIAHNSLGENQEEKKQQYIKNALEGFMKSISLGASQEHKSPYLFQDSLRLLSIIFEYGELEEVNNKFLEDYKQIDIRAWIEVVPQIIARISISKKDIQRLLHQLLIHIANHHPQALIYPLTVACKSKTQGRQQAANQIISDIKTHSPTLVNQAMLISAELNRTAILFKEQWHEGIKEAWESFLQGKNSHQHLIKVLLGLHEMMTMQPESLSEISFHQNFGAEVFEAEAWLQRYNTTENEICLCQAFDIYYKIYQRINHQLESLDYVYLENVSPKLLETKNCEISIPGLYKPSRPVIKISCFQPKLDVLFSKMHPRKLFIYGSDSKEYHFLLKGREDIRQDERVMQLFALVNRLLHNNPETEKKALNITRYSVIPLSINTGIIGWVHNCDTLQSLIKEYRKAYNIRENPEMSLMDQFCTNYSALPLPNKVEIFRHIIENTKGEDLKKILWLKSPNSEIWLERRTNYTRSLATMSIAGYILGLGDRHPSNIMLQRQTGKIVHIDFGDCFEVAMRREKFPERVPFRLTRMLVNAMEACGIVGNYRNTCELVMKVIRENKESLIAVLEAFVYDPLINWRLIAISGDDQGNNKIAETKGNKNQDKDQQKNSLIENDQQQNYLGSIIQQGTSLAIKKAMKQTQKNKTEDKPPLSFKKEKEQQYYEDEEKEQPQEIINKKALEVMDRIKKKLNGKDFKENEQLSYVEQVNKLINQATSHENICQAYMGWCPFW
ncbi:phosphatidylinositol 3- and 4-kinase family protein, putative [Ichthyophthirius multifiliis]|uniref:Serine/threonine-protein kinase TOR n=1 Tax=Ichthyophthirius multifiliis TaxID=5932 RepID=G0QV49_ICHMU|nr:phosphatidylinositol 3- and 4-kinase family protein, putative [Ichthyophthirius multifiliis]EGR30890.1 phosphatidylinositol 3- and 4-kinase family protein, putative [Ichthyophthirius multifiliis]|eukprot:XP_004032477.1 phosphatidylinositol 3- and 4-kinase family protein, putative [Ichthyophthirius multifiliis]